MVRTSCILSVCTLLSTTACPPPEAETTPESVAAYFGLVEGRTMRYVVTGGASASEQHEHRRSQSYAERWVVTRTERNQGFVRLEADGTPALTDFESTIDGIRMLARGDGNPRLVEYQTPVPVVAFPVTVGDRVETTSATTVIDGAGQSEHSERHVFVVASQGSVSAENGDHEAFEIAWQRFVDEGAVESATLYLAPELGLVRIDRADGAQLSLEGFDG